MTGNNSKFEALVRAGYFSRAILYTVLGLIALFSAGKIAQGTDGVFTAIREAPAGQFILWFLVLGLFAYGLFRLASPLFDIENSGSDGKGWATRLGHLGSAIGHFALAYTAYKFATAGGDNGNGAQQAASGVLSAPAGGAVLGLLGLAFFAAAAQQARKSLSGEFMHRVSPRAPAFTKTLGTIGLLARAVVFGVIGWSLFRAGFLSAGATQIKTLGEAVASLADNGIVFTLVALGLLIFGLFSAILARYAIVPDLDAKAKIPAYRHS